MRAALDEVQAAPEIGDPLHRELAGRRRVRVGQLRIVYRVLPQEIQIVAIGPRSTIYRELLERESAAGTE